MRESFRSLVVAAVLTGAANIGFSQVAADDRPVDAGPALEAITLLGRFPAEVERITTEISRVPLPAGGVSYECKYPPAGKAIFFVKDHTLRYSSKISFSGLASGLQPTIQAVQTSSKQFAGSFTPMLRKWAQTSLPQSSAAFNSALIEIQTVQDEMKRGIGPSESQRTRVIAALDRILASLKDGKGELTAMTGILGKYLLEQRAARGSLSNWSASATGQVQSYGQKSREEMNQQRCKGDGPAQLDTLVRNTNASITMIKDKIGELEKRDNEADKALSIVLGTFVGYSSRYEAVTSRLKVVQESPLGSTIQSLHLAIATRTWQDLVGAAKESGL
jgi:hypothetical protein